VGYKALFYYLSQEADYRIEARIRDVSTGDKGLLTFKIPLQIPYVSNSTDFEPAEGEITIDGYIYKLVKKRILRDTLIVLCIDHKEKTRIEKQDNDLFQKLNDLTANSPKKQDVKQIKTDYVVQDKLVCPCLISEFHKTTHQRFISGSLLPGHSTLIASPPQPSFS
jgi:hypothetical protein